MTNASLESSSSRTGAPLLETPAIAACNQVIRADDDAIDRMRADDRPRGSRRRPAFSTRYPATIRNTSSSNAAAVTSAPAPGPWISNGCAR